MLIMKRGFLFYALMIACTVFAVVSLGGCGGSGGSDVAITNERGNETDNDKNYTFTGNPIIVGDVNSARLAKSELAPYIEEAVRNYSGDKNDMLIMSDASELSSGQIEIPGQGTFTSEKIREAYLHGLTLVAVYPDADDIEALNNLLNLDLTKPDANAPDPHFEFLGVGIRPLSNETIHTFVYVASISSNHEYLNGLNDTLSVDVDEYVSGDVDLKNLSEAELQRIVSEMMKSVEGLETVSSDKMYAASCRERVWAMLNWGAGLNDMTDEVEKNITASVENFVQATGENDELLSVATGVTTDWDDHISMPFNDWADKKLKGTFLGEVIDIMRHFSSHTFDKISINRNTHTHTQVISLHSFDTHKDYYLVIAWNLTNPQDVCLVGGYAFGYTRKLGLKIYPNYNDTVLENWEPHTQVNHNRTYNQTNGWATTNAVSVSTQMGGATGNNGGMSGNVSVSYSYSKALNHSSSTTWTTNDYDILPLTYYDNNGRPYAYWNTVVDWPSGSQSLSLVTAAKESLRSDGEAIFSVGLNESSSFELYGRSYALIGTSIGGYSFACTGDYSTKRLNKTRPLHTCFTGVTQEGNRYKNMYLAMFNTEDSWTAETDVDWISLTLTSGEAGSNRFYYEVNDNNTGTWRRGKITVKSGNDEIYFTFTQGG